MVPAVAGLTGGAMGSADVAVVEAVGAGAGTCLQPLSVRAQRRRSAGYGGSRCSFGCGVQQDDGKTNNDNNKGNGKRRSRSLRDDNQKYIQQYNSKGNCKEEADPYGMTT